MTTIGCRSLPTRSVRAEKFGLMTNGCCIDTDHTAAFVRARPHAIQTERARPPRPPGRITTIVPTHALPGLHQVGEVDRVFHPAGATAAAFTFSTREIARSSGGKT